MTTDPVGPDLEPGGPELCGCRAVSPVGPRRLLRPPPGRGGPHVEPSLKLHRLSALYRAFFQVTKKPLIEPSFKSQRNPLSSLLSSHKETPYRAFFQVTKKAPAKGAGPRPHNKPHHSGPATTGPTRPGPARLGPARPDSARPGPAQLSAVRSVPDRRPGLSESRRIARQPLAIRDSVKMSALRGLGDSAIRRFGNSWD